MHARGRRLLQVAAALTTAFAVLATIVATSGPLPGEDRLLRSVHGRAGDRLDDALRLVDAATDSAPLLVLTAGLVALLLRSREAWRAARLATAVVGAVALNPLLKQLVDRPRPTVAPLGDVSALSFPSGHAATTAALALGVVLLARGTRRARTAALAGALLVVTTAAAQLLLAQHHPSDLLGGWLWASAWTLAVEAIGARHPPYAPG